MDSGPRGGRGELAAWRAECRVLDRLLEAVRAGESRVLVVHGEPGVGKTALPDYLSDIDLLILRSELRHALSGIGARHREAVVGAVLRDRPYADVAASSALRPAPCAPGSTTASGGCAACWKPQPRPEPGP